MHPSSKKKCLLTHRARRNVLYIQAVLLLGRYSMHQGSQAASWLMQGLASRMLIALKLTEEFKVGKEYPRDPCADHLHAYSLAAETRRRLAWAVYVSDSFINGALAWCGYTERVADSRGLQARARICPNFNGKI